MRHVHSPCLIKGDRVNTYDYVVVGAGSAGCVLAARLTEDPAVTVALIEAGGPDTAQEIHVPAAFNMIFRGPGVHAREALRPELSGAPPCLAA
jgi:choline dehydrogenase-like flavoprotein